MKKNKIKKISVLIPVYNEEKTVMPLLRKVENLKLPGIVKEIIIIDDGSTDKSETLIKSFIYKKKGIKLISLKNNQGKGASLKKGFSSATGDVLVIQDADLEYPPKNIKFLLKPILKNDAKVVYGSRKLNKNNRYSSFAYYLGGAFINFLIAKFIKQKALDFIGPLNSKGFEFDTEISIKIVNSGYKIEEVPIIYNPRLHKDGKKIRWYHSFRIIWTIVKSIN